MINGVSQAGDRLGQPDHGRTHAVGGDRHRAPPRQRGCDANLTDIQIQGTIVYATAEAPNPGCWEGYYAANLADGSLIYNYPCLGGTVGLAFANGWVYRGSHNHDCGKNAGGFVGPNNSNNFVWYRLEALPALRRPARPLDARR